MQLEVNLSLDHFLACWPCNQGVRWHQKTLCQNSWDFCQMSKFLWAVTKVDRASNHVYGQFNKELVCETCKIICLPHKSDDCRKYHENLILLTRFNCDHAVIKWSPTLCTCLWYSHVKSTRTFIQAIRPWALWKFALDKDPLCLITRIL